MIITLIETYYFTLLSISCAAALLLGVGLYFILRKHPSVSFVENPEMDTDEFAAFAGEDVITTQLDLARAYIETGEETLAKSILSSIIAQGTSDQKAEAQSLLSVL